MPGEKIRLLIVDDSALYRGVLSRGVSADPDIEVVATGAVDFVAKPDLSVGRTTAAFLHELIEKVKVASRANIFRTDEPHTRRIAAPVSDSGRSLIAIGASTGGTEAIYSVVRCLPPSTPGIVIVQHIPPVFSRMFADRLNNTTQLRVREARSGDYVEPGLALVAPGDRHMRVKKLGDNLRVELFEGAKTNGHCPSVDVLFESVAACCAGSSVGVILTGMGADGARGLLSMRSQGARTIGQDAKSSVVYGMPKAAYELGAVERQVPLEQIPQAISDAISS